MYTSCAKQWRSGAIFRGRCYVDYSGDNLKVCAFNVTSGLLFKEKVIMERLVPPWPAVASIWHVYNILGTNGNGEVESRTNEGQVLVIQHI